MYAGLINVTQLYSVAFLLLAKGQVAGGLAFRDRAVAVLGPHHEPALRQALGIYCRFGRERAAALLRARLGERGGCPPPG